MIIVDDRLCIDAVAGQLGRRHPDLVDAPDVVTTWSFHYRLVRALRDGRRAGALSSAVSESGAQRLADPPPSRLRVLDPRDLTEVAADVAVRHGANVLAAELVAAAIVGGGRVVLSERNVGRRWPDILSAEGIDLLVV